MIVKWQGKDYTYEPGNITVREAIAIKLYTGCGLVSWQAAVRDADPQAMQALLWLVKSRNAEPCEMASLDFDVMAFLDAYVTAILADKELAAAVESAPKAVDSSVTPADSSPPSPPIGSSTETSPPPDAST